MKLKLSLGLWFALTAFLLQSCFYEYPRATTGNFPGIGDDPTSAMAYVQISFNLDWQNISHAVEFENSTRNTTLRPYRFIIEVSDFNNIICRDEIYLSENEYAHGSLIHRLSIPLNAREYHIAAWCDKQEDDNSFPYNVDSLSKVVLSSFSTTDAGIVECGYASEVIDLRDIDMEKETSIEKKLTMIHPGARFEIVATDVQQFITDQKEALYQGDKFTAFISFYDGAYSSYNVYSQSVNFNSDPLQLSGWMRLPYAEYDELKIAEGFFFCHEEDEVTARITITNSSMVPVTQTDYFSFPVKRGYITTVSGDFLTNSLDGLFSINKKWEGEINVDIDEKDEN